MRPLLPWLLILSFTPALAQPPFDARDLTPARNQISNPSFEASTQTLPPSYTPVVGPAFFSVSREQAFHGQSSLLIAGTGTRKVEEVPIPSTTPPTAPVTPPPAAVLRQDVPACGGCTYDLSGWMKHASPGEGEAWLALEMLGKDDRVLERQQVSSRGDDAGWRQVTAQVKAPRETVLVRVLIGADPGVSAYVDALRLRITAGRAPRIYRSSITNLHAPRLEPTWATITWDGPVGPYEISYRQRRWPRDQSIISKDVPGFSYSLVGLSPETLYQVQLRLIRPEHYDEQGRVVESPIRLADPKPLSITTSPWRYREVGLLRMWSPRFLQLLDGPGGNPRIEAAKDHLYLAQEFGGGIHVSKLPPDTLAPVWTRQLVAPAADGPSPVLQDIHVLNEMLYVLYQRGPAELGLIAFNLELEQAEEPVVLPLGEPATRITQASLAGYRNQLWVLWLDEMGSGLEVRGMLRLALFSGGRLIETYAWSNAPVPVPAEPSLALFGDELIIPFSDTLAEALEPSYQPLHLVAFDGLTFGAQRKLRDIGRNRQPRAWQLGPNLYLLFTSDANYLSYEGRYRDLMLATLPPGRMGLETVTYLDDQKFNLSPDIVALGNSLWTVHDKYDYAPTAAAPAPYHFGVFIGRIDFGPVRQ